jgi:alanyl-tRNA synthetase
VARTGDIGYFKIISESSIAAGVRRIEAVTGMQAVQYAQGLEQELNAMAQEFKVKREEIRTKMNQLLDRNKHLEKELERVSSKLAANASQDLILQAKLVQGIQVIAAEVTVSDVKALRQLMDEIKSKLKPAVIVLGQCEGDKVNLIVGVTDDCPPALHAGNLINQLAPQVGGRGGGRRDMAQAGGNNPGALASLLASVPGLVATV